MRKVAWLLGLLALGLLTGAASAQTAGFNGVCSQGGVSATVQGLNSTNKLNGIIPSCTVTVYLTGTTTKATIFKDALGTTLSNPFTANALGPTVAAPGQWLFFAATGQGYDVVMSGGIPPLTYTLPVTLTDLQAGGGGSAGTCGPLSSDATSTDCGNGNFTSFTGTHGQAFGYTNIGTISQSYVVAVGNNSVTGGTGSNQDIIGIGDFAATNIGTSGDLIAIGDSPAENVAVNNAIFVGDSSGTPTSGTLTGSDLIGIGDTALGDSTGSSAANSIVAIGASVGVHLNFTTGTTHDLVILGDGAGSDYTSAVDDVVAIGNGAGSYSGASYSPSTFAPTDLVAIGDGSGTDNGGSVEVAVGLSSGVSIATGSHDIVGVGNSSATGSIINGTPHIIPVINDVVGIGDVSAARDSGNNIVAIGDWALGQTACGTANAVGNTGNDNVAIGDHPLAANTSGTQNVAIGMYAGSLGWTACNPGDYGNSNQTGSNNTWIGANTGPNTATQLSNTIALGYNAQVAASNSTVIGNSSITSLTIYGTGNGCLSSTSGVITGSGSACGSGGGGGSNVEVNGGGTLATVNLSSTTPAAPTNGINVTWATPSGINVSAAIVGDGNASHFLNGQGAFTAPSGSSVSITSSTGDLTLSPSTITGTGTIDLNLAHANTWSALQTYSAGINLSGSSSPLEFAGSAGTSGQCPISGGAGVTPTWGSCGSGGSGITGQTAGFVGLAGSATTITATSPIDYNITNAGDVTVTKPVVVAASGVASHEDVTYSGTADSAGGSTTARYSVNSSGQGLLGEGGAALSRLCTAANGVCATSTTDTRPIRYTTTEYTTIPPGGSFTFSTSPTSPSTAGTITQLHMTFGASNGDGYSAASLSKLLVTCDGDTETVPLGLMFSGMDNPVVFATDYMANTLGYAANLINSMNKKVEINYSTGCTLTFVNGSWVAALTFFSDTQYRVGANVSRPSRQHWRSTWVPQTSVAQYAVLPVLNTIGAADGGEAEYYGLWVVGNGNVGFDEGDPTVTTDGSTAVTSGGTEDFFGCGYNCGNTVGGMRTGKWGMFYGAGFTGTASLLATLNPYDQLTYRFFDTSDGDNVLFTSSLAAAWPNGQSGQGTPPGTVEAAALLTWWTHDPPAQPVTYSPGAGQISLPATVTLATTTSGATICYTTNGTAPQGNGAGGCTVGTSGTSVTVSSGETIQAIATKSGFADSSITSSTYAASASLGYVTGNSNINLSTTSTAETSGSITFTAGDHAIIFCRASVGTNALINVISSVGTNQIVSIGQMLSTAGQDSMFYVDQMTAGAATFTCTSNTLVGNLGITVLQYHAASTHFFNALGNNLSTTATPVTDTFSTTAAGLVVACFDPQFGASTLVGGNIGGTAANVRLGGGALFQCEDLNTTGAQTNITANMSNSNSGTWAYGVITFQ